MLSASAGWKEDWLKWKLPLLGAWALHCNLSKGRYSTCMNPHFGIVRAATARHELPKAFLIRFKPREYRVHKKPRRIARWPGIYDNRLFSFMSFPNTGKGFTFTWKRPYTSLHWDRAGGLSLFRGRDN